MAIAGLKIIGESLNDSIPSTQKLYNANDIAGLMDLVRKQDEKGAAYIDVNVGRRSAEFMADMVRKVQEVTSKPLSIDTPDRELARAGLKAYDRARAGGKIPILNSISPLRTGMFELYREQPFMPILMVTERVESGESKPNHTAEDIFETARQMLKIAREYKIPNEELIFDPGIAPAASDAEGLLKATLGAMKLIHESPDFKGVHMSVGLSNFSHMLPSKTASGQPVRGPLESAFLTKAVPLGLDMVIGSVARNYQILSPNHPAMKCIEAMLQAEGFDAILCVKDFYSE